MNTSNAFQETIKQYLDNKANEDTLFAEKYHNEKKNIVECCSYIITQVQAMKVCGLADDEVYNLAVHYYDEDVTDVKKVDCRVVVNHVVELTDEEKQQARQDAINELKNQTKAQLTKKPEPKKQETEPTQNQLSLF